MSKEARIVAEKRQSGGSSTANRLRRAGVVPAVVYGSGKSVRNIQLNEHVFSQFLRHHTSENVLVDLEIEGDQPCKVLIREIQHHPLTGKAIHVDFYELSMTKKVRVEIAIEVEGEPVGVTQQGGNLEHILREVEVECLPTDLVEAFTVDVSALEIGDSLSVEDLPIDRSKFTVLTAPDVAVVAVAAARVEEEVETAPAEGEAGAEPEVIGEKERAEAAEKGTAEKAPAEKGKEKEKDK